MIKTEFLETRADGVKLYRTYSDEGMMIEQVQTGVRYSEAVDVENSGFTYIETDEPIEVALEEPDIEKEEEKSE